MDWPLDNRGLADADLSRVFRFAPQATTVIRFLKTDTVPKLWFIETARGWVDWLEQNAPSITEDSGLVLILARRGGVRTDHSQPLRPPARVDTDLTFTTFNENDHSYSWPREEKIPGDTADRVVSGLRDKPGREFLGGGREVRVLPFDKDTFRSICRKFLVHSSISRVVSRADVPFFSRSQVMMETGDVKDEPCRTIVYNCRSANTWVKDLALTATYIPHSRLTLGILFGCDTDIERQVYVRVKDAYEHLSHPMFLPGMFSELERARMAEVVEATIDGVEGAIYELDQGSAANETVGGTDISETAGTQGGGARYTRRTVWLNMAFLRTRLQVWKTQMAKMMDHLDELTATDYGRSILPPESGPAHISGDGHDREKSESEGDRPMRYTSWMIRDRLRALLEEFEEKIQECTMRIDGMAIATQWSQGDTNVDIALATKQDSSQMRSIALVTMVFLPGTFFATLFSMTFFNWFPSGGSSDAVVSKYVWIYFLLTGVFTTATLLLWWYFIGFRRGSRQRDSRWC